MTVTNHYRSIYARTRATRNRYADKSQNNLNGVSVCVNAVSTEARIGLI